MRKLNNKSFVVVLLFLIIWGSGYIYLRQKYLKVDEFDGCPDDGCKTVAFPANSLYFAFSPLIMADRIFTNTKIYIKANE